MRFPPCVGTVLWNPPTGHEPCRVCSHLFSRKCAPSQNAFRRHLRTWRHSTTETPRRTPCRPKPPPTHLVPLIPSIQRLDSTRCQGISTSAKGPTDLSAQAANTSKDGDIAVSSGEVSEAHQSEAAPANLNAHRGTVSSDFTSRPGVSVSGPQPRTDGPETTSEDSYPQLGKVAEEKKKTTPEEKYKKLSSDALSELYTGTIPAQVVPAMLRTIRAVRTLGLPDQTPEYIAETIGFPERARRLPSSMQMEKTSMLLLRDLVMKRKDPLWRERLKIRLQLPVMSENRHAKIIEALGNADVLIIPGSTGSGKTTQVPQIILDYAIQKGRGGFTNVICTQPRRISATSVARRVAYERNESLGTTVGHHVRYSAEFPRRNGSILYCTTGMLWKYLQYDPDSLLDTSSHIIIDEVHERSAQTDVILLTLRNILHQRRDAKRPYPKLILMSATINAQAFIDYFSDTPAGMTALRTSVLEIPGRLHPITSHYLEDFLPALRAEASKPAWLQASQDYLKKETEPPVQESVSSVADDHFEKDDESGRDTLADSNGDVDIELDDPFAAPEEAWNFASLVPTALVALSVVHVLRTTLTGDVLVFLPGLVDIQQVAKYLEEEDSIWIQRYCSDRGIKVFQLHSAMSETNDQVFESIPAGWRRVVLSSNIAETSVTLPEVQHVIDTGTTKTLRLDRDNGSRGLATTWIDQQSQQQRRGRAGRVSAGTYYALYTKVRSKTFAPETRPELLTHDLTRFALELKSSVHSMDLATAFALAPDPPGVKEVQWASDTLKRLGAITSDEELTPLGRVLSLMSRDPAAAKAAVLGILFRCFEPMLIAAAMDDPSRMIVKRHDAGGTARSRWEFSRNSENGIIASINAFKEYNEALDSGDQARAVYLTDAMGIHPIDCMDLSRNAQQICQELMPLGLLPVIDMHNGIFPKTPSELNVNSENIPLIKTLLSLTIQSETAVRFTRHTWLSRQGLMIPARNFVNETMKARLLTEGLGGRVPSRGDLMSYTYGKKVDSSGHKVIMESSMITPLMALLTADGASISADTGMINVGGIINMKIDFSDDSAGTSLPQKMHLAFEFRKMIERFQEVAFATLSYEPVGNDRSPLEQPSPSNEMFTGTNELRDTMIQGFVSVLDVDAQAEADMLEKRREVWLEQQAANSEESKRDRADKARAQAQKEEQTLQMKKKKTQAENLAETPASKSGDSALSDKKVPISYHSRTSKLQQGHGQFLPQTASDDLPAEDTVSEREASAAIG